MEKITEKIMKLLRKNWKRGYIRRFEFPGGCREELKRLRIISYNEKYMRYDIDREMFAKINNEKQEELFS